MSLEFTCVRAGRPVQTAGPLDVTNLFNSSGVRASGVGREGPPYTIQMTGPRLLVINRQIG